MSELFQFDFFPGELVDFVDVDLVVRTDEASVSSDLKRCDHHLVTGDVSLQVFVSLLFLLV